MTASRALRNAPDIAHPTRRKILELADALGYRPDPLIQRLASHLADSHRRNQGQVIAWINSYKTRRPWNGQIPFVSMYQGAAAQAEKLGFQLEEFWLGEPGMTGRRMSNILYHRGIDCLILAPIPKGGGHLTMDWEKFSAVAIGYAMLFPRLHRVGSHHLHGARESIRQLYRRGYRRIGLCLSNDGNLRLDHSWLEALAYHQLRTPRKNWVKPLVQANITSKHLLSWVEREKPDCILSQFEWTPQALKKARYSVPGDIAVAFFNVEYASPGGSGIDQRYSLIGETACSLVVGQHFRNEKGVPANPHTIMIEGQWIPGRTVLSKGPN